MRILLPKEYGFCTGVSTAITKALSVSGRAFCLGKLVHNAHVVDMLKEKGVVTVDSIEDVPDGETVIIRAHGAPPQVFDRAREKGLTVVDATCPYVSAIQKKAKKYHDEGYKIVLVGDAVHPEIQGINGWCQNTATVFDGKGELRISGCEKALVLFQTTFDTRSFEKTLQNIFADGVKTLEIFNTICYTTTQRQYYAQMLSKQCDLAVVVGDKHSSNTNRLVQIASQNCPTVLCDGANARDIDLNNKRNVCIISGASTPTELIKGVLERMVDSAKETVAVETVDAEATAAQTVAEVQPETANEAAPVAAESAAEEKVMDKNEAMLAKAVSQIKEGPRYRPGQKVKCRVVLMSEDGVYVSIPNAKKEGFIPNEELAMDGDYKAVKAELKADPDATIECAVISVDKGITLSKKVIDERYKDDELVGGIKEGKEFSVTMTRTGKNCLTGRLGSYTVVVHASQIKIGFVKELDKYVGKTLRLVSSEDKVDDSKHVIYASQKAILLAERKEKEDEFWNNIEEQEIVEGKVLRFASFGAFVDVRGFDCLAHTSDLSWERVNGPADVLEIGNTYEFVVLALDRENNRVSLGYKQLQPKPWELAEEKFPVGTIVKGKVARLMPYGAFIELDKHIDGLLHVSNYSWEWIDDINKVLKVGDEVEVEVLEFDAEQKRITLSRKALMERPENFSSAPEADKE
ncbi:MAG: 4-hydroxy-3-methylbut-2-enyl diphosphate reductase [Corallococcus sp.]|nr:4-hydroxy-3-methylbut-2-enyl diphosphate reductase [Corallococcus sp.]MCM1359681.1 4-hydroxy-3-methylbut-2-enyl diphosphate reductase [Corallococcus sp.]MCM1395390.1 4-hydroxy-3-methylbut-2-enyl diphosphate reductase [Corallococcus sp.]